MTCVDENTIVAFVQRRLERSERTRVAAHLDECKTCRRTVGELVRANRAERESTLDRTRDSFPTFPTFPTLDAAMPSSERGIYRFGRYVVLQELRRTLLSVVGLAWDPELGRKVVLHVFRSADLPETGQEALVRHARAMSRRPHPHVVPIVGAGWVESWAFVSVELVQGTTLSEWMRACARSSREILSSYRQAAEALAAAHAMGIVHGDFRAESVLVDGDGLVRVSDFGIALALDAGARARELDARRTPSTDRTDEEATPMIDQRAFCISLSRDLASSNDRVSVRLRAVLEKGAQPRAADRYASMRDLVIALDRSARRRVPVVAIVTLACIVLAAIAAARCVSSRTHATVGACAADVPRIA